MMLEMYESGRLTTIFDKTTTLQVDADNPHRFGIELDPLWSSLIGMHGGYLVAVAVKAAQAIIGDRPIRTVTTSFLRPGQAGPAEVDVELVRRGRSITTLTVTLSQSSKAVVVSHVTAADAVESTSWDTTGALDLPPIEVCVPITPPPGVGHFDHGLALLDPIDLPFSHGPLARVAGYMRPIESRAVDAPWLAMALDWFPPASFTRIDPPAGGISITYTVHVHRTMAELGDDEWLSGVFRADISAGAIALEKGMITDPSGRVLAESFHTRWTAGPDQLAVG
jgi:Acyl-CoA thioesterase N-terminal domain/Acyl-CoA thioesterase C-terminal domain